MVSHDWLFSYIHDTWLIVRIRNLYVYSSGTDEVAENMPFPDGKEISPTDNDWHYTTTGKPIITLKHCVLFDIKWEEIMIY